MAGSFSWLSRDARTLYVAGSLRSFSYGFLAIVLGLYLGRLGMSAFQVGALITAMRFGGAVLTLIVGQFGDYFGRKRTLVALSALATLGGLAFAAHDAFWWLALTATFGNLSSHARDRGPFSSVEQATLASTTPEGFRTKSFGYYLGLATAVSAVGSLAAAAPALLAEWSPIDEVTGMRLMFVAYAAISAIAGALYLMLTPAVEVQDPRRHGLALPPSSRGTILRMSWLYGIDSFGGGLVLTSFIAYFFSVRWGVDLSSLAVIFFVIALVIAASQVFAAWLAARIGLINTMVWTHLPSNLFLIAVAFAPTAPLAVAFYLLREALSQMDVPTRQSYTVAVVPPADRTAAAGITTVARNTTGAVSPVLGGLLAASANLAAPFVASGALKVFYDLLLFATLRRTLPPEEVKARAARRVG